MGGPSLPFYEYVSLRLSFFGVQLGLGVLAGRSMGTPRGDWRVSYPEEVARSGYGVHLGLFELRGVWRVT